MITASEAEDIAILGFGFGGLMVLANLVRLAEKPMRGAIISPDLSGHGLAYSTPHTHHLLNVPAANMGAWAHAIDDFAHWLESDAAHAAQHVLPLPQLPAATDFAPRALYAHYLTHLLQQTRQLAQQKSIALRFVARAAESLKRQGDTWIITTTEGEIAARQVVLATGNEVKPVFPQVVHPTIHQSPWHLPPLGQAGPIAIIGTGLTAVDTILTLRSQGYAGDIIAISRNGLWPQPHRRDVKPYRFDAAALHAQKNLAGLLRHIRAAISAHGDWRGVVDALRLHSQALWQKLEPRDQQRAIRRLATLWSIHRHRMAPEIAVRTAADNQLRTIATRSMTLAEEGGELLLTVQHRADGETEMLRPAAIINCTGPELNWARSAQPLLRGLLRDGYVTAHPTGLGAAATGHDRIGENLFAIGSLMTGQFWESTAVPELRAQAAAIAEALCR